MGVRVGRQARERIAAAAGTFAIQVRQASDLGAAISALQLARVDILGLATGINPTGSNASSSPRPSVSPVVNAPGGPMLLLEHVAATRDALASIPDVVVRRLEKAAVANATIEVPLTGGSLDRLDAVPNAVILRLFPSARGGVTALPPDWIDIAAEWVTGDIGDDEPVAMRVLGVEFAVAGAEVAGVMHECALARAWCDSVNGDLSDRVRTASLTFGRLPHLALAAAGPRVDNAGLLARFHLLQEITRELAADVAYACIDFEPTLEGVGTGLSPSGWQSQGGAPPNTVARELLDERVPDAFPYQVLGPGHLARLADHSLPLEHLGDGRAEVNVEHPRSWLIANPERDDAQAQGWDLLQALLVAEEELAARLDEHRGRGPHPSGENAEELDLAALGSIPELDAIVLERGRHPRRGTRLSLLELVSWLNHEAHSDAPDSVSPVAATYARWLADGLDHETRQRLKAVAPRLIGTGPSTIGEEAARRWLATEQLVRVHAPAWLRAAGLTEPADRLATLGPLTQHLELVRAVDVLGTAILAGSHRIEITTSIVNDDAEVSPDEQSMWAAWERVSESTGWVAASEAATHGAPAELTYATDFRVIECSRDPRARDELEAARKSIGDSAWTTALHAVADEAWEQAWRAADIAARELSGFTLRAEMERVARSLAEDRSWQGDEDAESILDMAERAARDSLTRAALSGGSMQGDEHAWDAARNAARLSPNGKEWAIVSDEARRAIGEDAWAQAMADARAVVTELLDGIPDTVARVVVAAVAREASSAAARGVALRAASVARANGGDDDAADAAANQALDEVAVDLQARSFELLDRMIDPAAIEAAATEAHSELRVETGAMAPTSNQHST
ncbi:MAG TPA: hypothetical protein VGJ03_08350 [Acidimicrobiales bacterium]